MKSQQDTQPEDIGTLLLNNMYLPKSKYNVKHTKGGEIFNPNGSEYIGFYIETFTGEIYTGKSFSKNTIKLTDLRLADLTDDNPLVLKNDFIRPTDQDYLNEKFNRYYIQDRRTKNIVEVNKDNYKRFDPLSYTISVIISWVLKGPVGDINKGPYIYFGAASQNKESIIEAEKTIKGLSQIVNNYGEFVV
jgi:hypothetical protein